MNKRETEQLILDVVGEGNYEYLGSVQLTSIDDGASAREQVRITMTDPELVERYGIAMLDGAEFPPILLARDSGGKLRRIDGNNRYAAKVEIGAKDIEAFVLGPKVTDLQKEVLKIALNEHGKPHSREERLREAERLVRMGMTQEAAAKLGRMSVGSLRSYIGLQRGKERLTEAGVSAKIREELPSSSIIRIGSLRENEVIKATARIAYEYGVHSEEVSKFVAQLSALRSEEARKSELAAWRRELGSRRSSAEKDGVKPTGRKTTPYATFMRAAGLMLRESPRTIVGSSPDRKLLREKAEQVIGMVKEVLGAA